MRVSSPYSRSLKSGIRLAAATTLSYFFFLWVQWFQPISKQCVMANQKATSKPPPYRTSDPWEYFLLWFLQSSMLLDLHIQKIRIDRRNHFWFQVRSVVETKEYLKSFVSDQRTSYFRYSAQVSGLIWTFRKFVVQGLQVLILPFSTSNRTNDTSEFSNRKMCVYIFQWRFGWTWVLGS